MVSISKYSDSHISCQLNCAPNKPFDDILTRSTQKSKLFYLNNPKLDYFPLQVLPAITFGLVFKATRTTSIFISKWESGGSNEEKGKRIIFKVTSLSHFLLPTYPALVKHLQANLPHTSHNFLSQEKCQSHDSRNS